MEVNVSLYIHQAVPIVSDLAQNVSRVMPRDASQWDGSQRKTNANEVPVKNVSKNANLVKAGFIVSQYTHSMKLPRLRGRS